MLREICMYRRVFTIYIYILLAKKKKKSFFDQLDNNLENLLCSIEERFENKIGSEVKVIVETLDRI